MTLNKIRTNIWSVITRDKRLIKTNHIPQKSLVYFKNKNTPMIYLSV